MATPRPAGPAHPAGRPAKGGTLTIVVQGKCRLTETLVEPPVRLGGSPALAGSSRPGGRAHFTTAKVMDGFTGSLGTQPLDC